MDLKELKDFIKSVAKSGVLEVKIETDDLKLKIKVPPKGKAAITHTETVIQQIPVATPFMQQPFQQSFQQVAPPTTNTNVQTNNDNVETEDTSKYIEIKSPMVGTFYRKPSPDKATFINVGDSVNADTVVCIIEAMKLFNEIEAEVSGKIVKILVDDTTPVEFEQPLFLVDPK